MMIKRFLSGSILCLLLLGAAQAYAQEQDQAILDHVEAIAGADALSLNLYFTVAGDMGAVTEAVLLLEDGSRHEARVEKPSFYMALMLDTSGSMAGGVNAMRRAAMEVIQAAPAEVSFAVIGFDESITLLQPFTRDRTQAIAAVNQVESGDRGTCLYDAAATAVQSLEQLAQDAPRRALVLFTDGRDERSQGPCSRNTLEQLTALAAGRDVAVPIHAVSLPGSGSANVPVLRNLAEATGGRLMAPAELPEQLPQLMADVQGQWLARADLYPPQGQQRGMLLLTVDGAGRLPPLPFTFTAPRNFVPPPRRVNVAIDDFRYDEGSDTFLFDVSLDNFRQVGLLRVDVVDSRTNLQAASLTLDVVLETQLVSLEATGLEAGRTYLVTVTSYAAGGEPLQGESGEPAAATYRFRYEPPQAPAELAFAIDSVRVKDDPAVFNLRSLRVEDDQAELIATLGVQNGEMIGRVEGYLVDETTERQVAEFEGALPPNQTVRAPLDVNAGRYTLVLRALAEDGAPLATARENFTYSAPAAPLRSAVATLRANPLLLVLALLLLVAGILIGWWPAMTIGRRSAARSATRVADTATSAGPEIAAAPPVRLRVVESPDETLVQGRVWEVAQSPFTIGREGCDLTVAGDFHVSRRHAQITRQDGHYFIEDLGSSNGTYVNEAQLSPHRPTPLYVEQETHIRIGRTTHLVLSENAPGAAVDETEITVQEVV